MASMDKKSLTYFALQLVLCITIYSPIYPSLYRLWLDNSGNNSHCMLVPFVSLYLIWIKRNQLDLRETEESYAGLWITVASLFIYIIGWAGGVEILPRIAFVCTLIGLVLFNLGIQVMLQLAFPLLFLFFMVPLPVSIVGMVSFPLQIFTTKISAFLLNGILQIPLFREGNILHFTNTSLEVAQACSGIRSLMAYLMLGALFAFLIRASMHRKIFLVLISIPIALVANIMRVTITGALAYEYGNSVAKGFVHEVSGFAIFIFGIIVFIILSRALETADLADTERVM